MKIITNSDKKHVREVLNSIKDELKNTSEGLLECDTELIRVCDKFENTNDKTIIEKKIKLKVELIVKPS